MCVSMTIGGLFHPLRVSDLNCKSITQANKISALRLLLPALEVFSAAMPMVEHYDYRAPLNYHRHNGAINN